MLHDKLANLVDRSAISDVIHRYATGVDGRDWEAFRAIFTDEVDIDLSSWNGAPGSRMSADAWVAGVRAGLSGFDSTQHISANHQITIDRDSAHCTSYVQASHSLGPERYVLGGYYESDLLRESSSWKISASRLTVTWRLGDPGLFATAAARLADGGVS
jgi:hypothetical protein